MTESSSNPGTAGEPWKRTDYCVCGHELGSESCCNFDDEVQGGVEAVYHPDAIEAAIQDAIEANAPEPPAPPYPPSMFDENGNYVPYRERADKSRKLARFSLIPPDVLWEVAEVLGWGATNRGDSERNWEIGGIPAGDLVDGIFRHLCQWEQGEDADEETGRSHLSHAICNLMFLRGLEMRGQLVDDRSPSVSGPLRSEKVNQSQAG